MIRGGRRRKGREKTEKDHSFRCYIPSLLFTERKGSAPRPTGGWGQADSGLCVGCASGLSASARGSVDDGTWSLLFCSGRWMLQAYMEMTLLAH